MQATNANQYFAGGSGFPDFMIFSLNMLKTEPNILKCQDFLIITGSWSVQPLHRTPDSLIRFDTIISAIGELKLPGIHFFIDETLDAELL